MTLSSIKTGIVANNLLIDSLASGTFVTVDYLIIG